MRGDWNTGQRACPDRLRREGERGVILLLALFVVALFAVLVLEFNYATRVEFHMASTYRDDVLALNIAKAGVYETIALLREDRLKEIEEKEKEDEEKGRPKEDEKAAAEKAKKAPPGALKDIPYADHYGEDWAKERFMEPFGPGFLSVKVLDETGKININTLVKEQKPVSAAPKATPTPAGEALQGASATPAAEIAVEEEPKPPPRRWGQKDEDASAEAAEREGEEEEVKQPEPVRYVVDKKVEKNIMRLLETLDVRGVDPEKVTAAIVDWMDSNGEGDWEERAYRESEGASPPKNAPLDLISELLMIQGVTGDLYYGPKKPDVEYLEETLDRKVQRGKGSAGLRDCLTVCSKAKVNVNTAPAEVLTALLPEENESLVKEITAYTRKKYFEDLNHFEEEIGEHIPASFKAGIGVGSDSFLIISEGRVNEARRQIRARVYRDDEGNVKILEWRVVR